MTKNNSTTKENRSFATLRMTKGKKGRSFATLRMTKGKKGRSFATLRMTKGKTLRMTKGKALRMTKGFTMIEIIVILFIVSIGIVGVLSLIVQNISSQSYDKNNLIAAQLAQEGIELIRKVRDSNWKAGSSFDQDLVFDISNPSEDSTNYYMDYLDTRPQLYGSLPAGAVLRQDSGGFYVNGNRSGTDTIFSRLITIAKLNTYSLQVNSAVTWSDRQRNYSYNLETLLYDWK